MSDRIGVMRAGRIVQSGPPGEIYDRPADRFVADFIGDTTILEGTASGITLTLPGGWHAPLPSAATGAAAIALRPERVRLVPQGAGLVDATVEEANFLGDSVLMRLLLPEGATMLARVPRGTAAGLMTEGARVALTWDAADGVLLNPPCSAAPIRHATAT